MTNEESPRDTFDTGLEGTTMDAMTEHALADNPPKRGKTSRRRKARKVEIDNIVDRLTTLFNKKTSVTMVTAFLHSPNKDPVQFINSLSVLENAGFEMHSDTNYRAKLLGLWGKAVQKEPRLQTLPDHVQTHTFIGMMVRHKNLPTITRS